MFNRELDNHISRIEKSYSGKNCILIYKGFPISFIKRLEKKYPFLYAPQLTSENKIDLKSIIETVDQVIPAMLQKKSDIKILLYEQFYLLTTKIDVNLFKGQFIIVDNNLYSDFPNQSNEMHVDLDKEVESRNTKIKENEIFNEFYSNSFYEDEIHYIQFRDVEEGQFGNTKYFDFFNLESMKQALDIVEVDPDEIENKTVIEFPLSKQYKKFKYELFFDDNVDYYDFLVTDPVSLKNEAYLNELKILVNVLTRLNKKTVIYCRKYQSFKDSRNEFLEILQKHWKSSSFRDLLFYENPDENSQKFKISQGALIEDIVFQCENASEGKKFNDLFITAPTGAGKSVLFQIPAIYLAQKYESVTIVVSPLKALMYDQVNALKKRGINTAEYINSDISLIDRENILENIKKGEISIIYLSPELLLSYDISHFLGERKLGLLIIDEAHLVTTWGRDFRVDYWYIGGYVRKLRRYFGQSFPVVALTATAVYTGKNDIVFDTVNSLNMRTPKLYIGNVRRDEIEFKVNEFQYKGVHENEKLRHTEDIIRKDIDSKVKEIVYFPWTNLIRLVRDEMEPRYQKMLGIYFGDVDRMEKKLNMDKFQKSEITTILATKAFGMGVDISDVRKIYHYAPSGNLSDYIQEVGRAAREEESKGTAEIDFCDKDLKYTKILYGLSSIKQYQVQMILQKIWELYSQQTKRYFLASVEDFAYIFDLQEKDLGSKVKSALLLLEKDLLKKYGFNVIIVRPKNLFCTVYGCVPRHVEKGFLQKYGRYCKLVKKEAENVTTLKGKKNSASSESLSVSLGNTYEIQLDEIWERYFPKISFPMAKKQFFDMSLFQDFNNYILPKYCLRIKLKNSVNDTLKKIKMYLEIFNNVFGGLQDQYFDKEDLDAALKKSISSEILRMRLTELVVGLYTLPDIFGNAARGRKRFDPFITTKRDGDQIKYKILTNRYMEVKPYVVRKFSEMFSENRPTYADYIIKGPQSDFTIKVAYLLEGFMLGTYELSGGSLPKVFIRVNDPYKVRLLAQYKDYSNMILEDIRERQKESMRIMEEFFLTPMDNKQRWDYIENYFLGA